MKSVLIQQELWTVASEGLMCPEGSAEDKAVVMWKINDGNATAIIILSITAMQIAHVKNFKTSSKAWNTLRETHKPKLPMRKVTLFKRLLGMRMSNGERIQAYVFKFTSLVEKLES